MNDFSNIEGRIQQTCVWLINQYRRWISPSLPPACRFEPTCSQYAAESIRSHGMIRGLGLAFARLLKCHPFHPGGYDPVKK